MLPPSAKSDAVTLACAMYGRAGQFRSVINDIYIEKIEIY